MSSQRSRFFAPPCTIRCGAPRRMTRSEGFQQPGRLVEEGARIHPEFFSYRRMVAQELPQLLMVLEVITVVRERRVPAKVLRHPGMIIEEASKQRKLAVAIPIPVTVTTVPAVSLEVTHSRHEPPRVFAELFPRPGMVL